MTELAKLKETIAALDKEYRQSKGYSDSEHPSKDEMEDRMYQMMSNVYRYVDAVAERMYDHTSSAKHLPPCPSAEHMESALGALGWGKNYSVQKPVIYASYASKVPVFEIEYKK